MTSLPFPDRPLVVLLDESRPALAWARVQMERARRLAGPRDPSRSLQVLDGVWELLNDPLWNYFRNPSSEEEHTRLMGLLDRLRRQLGEESVEEATLQEEEVSPLDELADLNPYSLEIDPELAQIVNEDLLELRFDLPVVLNDSVLRFLNYYQNRGRRIMEEGLRRSGRFLPLFRSVFQEHGLPQDLVYMAHVESLFKPRAYSRAHARGLWQFISSTGRLYGLRQDWWIDERLDIVKSTQAAARHLRDLYAQFQDWYVALAAYNSGAHRIERIWKRYGKIDYWEMCRRRMLPRETRNYVPLILASILIFKHPEAYGFQASQEESWEFHRVPVREQIQLEVAAEILGVPVQELADLNPELIRGVTPFEYPDYEMKIPSRLDPEKFLAALANLPPHKKVRWAHHRVRQGDTLSQIARRYGSSIQAIAQVNRLRNIHRLRVGQDLIVPLQESSSSSSYRPHYHIVRRGDSLARIARLYGLRVQDLMRWNRLTGTLIHPGQQLRLNDPGVSSGSSGSAASSPP